MVNADRERATRAGVQRPWTVFAVVALMVVLMVAQMWADRFALTFSKTSGASYLVSFATLAIVLALFAEGLVRRSRVVWILAILWQLLSAGYGALHVVTNGYGWASVAQFTRVGFFEGALPALIGAINLVLLSLPATRAWIEDRTA